MVHDTEKTPQSYADFFGMKKPQCIITDSFDKANTEYRGKPSNAKAKLAFFRLGPAIELELIEPDREKSTWREFLNEKGEGVHHIAPVVKNMDKKISLMESNNMPLLQKGDYEGGRYAYFDSSGELKVTGNSLYSIYLVELNCYCLFSFPRQSKDSLETVCCIEVKNILIY